MNIGLFLNIIRQGIYGGGDAHPGNNLLLEDGFNILLENGTDALLLE